MKPFRLDRRNNVLLGVCSGLAETTGWNANYIRFGLVAVTLLGAFPWTLVAYGVAAWLGKPKEGAGPALDDRNEVRRWRMEQSERRFAEIERQSAGSNSRLAEEIERLR
jgi:phage shock protein C